MTTKIRRWHLITAVAAMMITFTACGNSEGQPQRLAVAPTGETVEVEYRACPDERHVRFEVTETRDGDRTLRWHLVPRDVTDPSREYIAGPPEPRQRSFESIKDPPLTVTVRSSAGTASLGSFTLHDLFDLPAADVLTGADRHVSEKAFWHVNEAC